MEKKVIVIAKVQEVKVQEFIELSNRMIEKSNAEKDCLSYQLYKSINNQKEFIFHEKYRNEEALEKHNSSEHFKFFINSVMPLLAEEPSIEVY